MNRVIYFSPTNSTKDIAEYCSNFLNIPLVDLTSFKKIIFFDYSALYNNIIICFPVYSQNIPLPVKDILKKIKTKNIIFIATYGRMATGNVLYEATKYTNAKIIGAAYVPTKHTYKDNERFSDFYKLDNLLFKLKINDYREASIPKRKKNIFACFLPNMRSRIGVKLKKTNNCTNCNICNQVCPTNSILNGEIKKTCIRCLSCLINCPNEGLDVSYLKPLRMYLEKDKLTQTIIYL